MGFHNYHKEHTSAQQHVHKLVQERKVAAAEMPKPPVTPVQSAPPVIVASQPKPVEVPRPSPKPTYTGSHQEWMTQAGINSADFAAVEYIISHESGWKPNAINKHSGSCGLPQALPCSKLGSNWNDPVTALKWANNYAISRYGSWWKAQAFWSKNRWW